MADRDFWKAVARPGRSSGRTGVLNIALLFATAAVALTLVMTPMLASKSEHKTLAFQPEAVDTMTTGSISKDEDGKRYTIRRSVLQETPGSVCIVNIYGNGQDC